MLFIRVINNVYFFNDYFFYFVEFDDDNNTSQDDGSGQTSNVEHVNVVEEKSSDIASQVRTILFCVKFDNLKLVGTSYLVLS